MHEIPTVEQALNQATEHLVTPLSVLPLLPQWAHLARGQYCSMQATIAACTAPSGTMVDSQHFPEQSRLISLYSDSGVSDIFSHGVLPTRYGGKPDSLAFS